MNDDPPLREDAIAPEVWRIAAVVLFGPLMSSLDSTIVNVSLASLSKELNSPLSHIQWVTTGYLLTLALTLPLCGWLVDRIGAKRLYLASFTLFTLSSLLCGLSPSADALIVARLLQGMAGGVLAPMAQMMMARAAGRHLAKVMGYMVVPIMIGPILGPVVAGAILDHASWHWIFLINIPIGAMAIWLAWWILPADGASPLRRPFDGLGFVLLSPALVGLLHSLEGTGSGSLSPWLGGLELGSATLLLIGFLIHSQRLGRAALVDISLFARPVFSAAASTQFLSNSVAYGGMMLVPVYFITKCGISPSATGWALAPSGLGMLCSYPCMGALTERFGPRKVSAAGALVALLGTIPFIYLDGRHLGWLSVALFTRGVGQGCINIPSMAAAYASVPREMLPTATTAINIVQRLGGPVGTTLLTIFLHRQAFAATFGLLALFHALAVVSALRLPWNVPETPLNLDFHSDRK